jgi:hypothetical protein
MTELLLWPLADAFMEVGVFVALMFAPFGYARYRWGHRLDAALVRHRALAPLVAAALTVPPGCGGAILVMAAYARGAVSFGAAIAALVATMGDASWVLLAAEPALTLQLKLVLFALGAGCGWVVDALGIAPQRRVDRARALSTVGGGAGSGGAAAVVPVVPDVATAPGATGAPARPGLHVQTAGILPVLLWSLVACATLVSLPVALNLLAPGLLYLTLGVGGAVLALVWFVQGGATLGGAAEDDPGAGAVGDGTTYADVLREGGYEVAFVTAWVALAYVAWSLMHHLTGFDGSQLPLYGLLGVVVGACVGLIPGCAVQIVFVGLFLAGGMPLSTLVANMVSQDGDALLPLLALEHRSALLATVLTTLPALVVGLCLLVLT